MALALLLWAHVATDKTYVVEATLPVTSVIPAKGMALLEPPPDSLLVQISATGKNLLRSRWRKSGVSIRLSETRFGMREVVLSPENVSLSAGKDVELQSVISPRAHRFNLDAYEERPVHVSSRVVVSPAEGFAVAAGSELTPKIVTAGGPRTSLARLKEAVTEEKVLRDVESDFDLPVRVEAPGLYGITFDPPLVNYRVNVYPVSERKIDSLPVALLNSPGEEIRVLPSYVNVVVSGAVADIDSLSPHQISVTADYSRRSADGSVHVRVALPARLRLVRVSDTLVWVNSDVDGAEPDSAALRQPH